MSAMDDRELTDRQVLDFLIANADFLERNPAAIELLNVPHLTGGESLIEYQVSVLRDSNRRLRRKLDHYLQVAATNEALLARIHSFHLALLRAASPAAVLNAVGRRLRDEFGCDDVALGLLQDSAGLPEHDLIVSLGRRERGLFGEFRRSCEPVCGRLRRERLEALFGARAEAVRSAAIIPLGHDGALGVLALGSADEHKFHPGMGTLFLSLLGQMLGQCLVRWTDSPRQPARVAE